MYHVNSRTKVVLDIMASGLSPGEGRRIDPCGTVFKPLFVTCVNHDIYVTAYLININGNSVSDPAVEWWRSAIGNWVPTCIHDMTGRTVEPVLMEGGLPQHCAAAELKDLVDYCNTWIGGSLPMQHGGIDAIRSASAHPPQASDFDHDEGATDDPSFEYPGEPTFDNDGLGTFADHWSWPLGNPTASATALPAAFPNNLVP